jgi:hypothetical protein
MVVFEIPAAAEEKERLLPLPSKQEPVAARAACKADESAVFSDTQISVPRDNYIVARREAFGNCVFNE